MKGLQVRGHRNSSCYLWPIVWPWLKLSSMPVLRSQPCWQWSKLVTWMQFGNDRLDQRSEISSQLGPKKKNDFRFATLRKFGGRQEGRKTRFLVFVFVEPNRKKTLAKLDTGQAWSLANSRGGLNIKLAARDGSRVRLQSVSQSVASQAKQMVLHAPRGPQRFQKLYSILFHHLPPFPRWLDICQYIFIKIWIVRSWDEKNDLSGQEEEELLVFQVLWLLGFIVVVAVIHH